MDDLEIKRPRQPLEAPVRPGLYRGYLDLTEDLKNFKESRRIESGTQWDHLRSPH